MHRCIIGPKLHCKCWASKYHSNLKNFKVEFQTCQAEFGGNVYKMMRKTYEINKYIKIM